MPKDSPQAGRFPKAPTRTVVRNDSARMAPMTARAVPEARGQRKSASSRTRQPHVIAREVFTTTRPTPQLPAAVRVQLFIAGSGRRSGRVAQIS